MTAKTTAERIAEYRKRQKALGRKKREFYLTDSENAKVVEVVADMRKSYNGIGGEISALASLNDQSHNNK